MVSRVIFTCLPLVAVAVSALPSFSADFTVHVPTSFDASLPSSVRAAGTTSATSARKAATRIVRAMSYPPKG
jgi:hypothetical protein